MRISDWSSDVCSSDLAVPAMLFPSFQPNGPGCKPICGNAKRQFSGNGHDPRPALPVERLHHLLVPRSEEHTSELQSLMRTSYAVFCLKKKKNTHRQILTTTKRITTPDSHTTQI